MNGANGRNGDELPRQALLALLRLGVREVVFCGGARNAVLAEPLLACGLRHWTHFDERAAAFFALGRCRDLDAPVAVVVTSGTAVAECLAATIEGHYQGLPLVVVSADRPRRFRGSGAPQAIEQVELLVPYVQFCADVEEGSELGALDGWHGRGPLQLNLCLEEPAAAETAFDAVGFAVEAAAALEQAAAPPGAARTGPDEDELALEAGRLGAFVNPCRDGELLVLVGDLPRADRPAAVDFLHRLQAPFWAEGSSGAREEGALAGCRIEHAASLAGQPWRRVLRLGAVPSCRFWRDLESMAGLEVLSVSRSGHSGLGRGGEAIRARLDELLPACGVRRQGRAVGPLRADRDRRARFDAALAGAPAGELARVRALATGIPGDALVYLGNSLPIRDWAEAAPRRGAGWEVHASRGANGIDGQIATFLGLAAGLAQGCEAWALLGDLTTLCDVPALLLAEALDPRLPLRLVVLNNGGGAIFRQLPALARREPALRLVENRHGQSLLPWARAAGWKGVEWRAGEPFPERLPNRVLIEVPC